jgi:purine-binding chemotaxis protein CheW
MNTRHLFVLLLDEQRYALHVAAVSRVVRMVEITPIPETSGSLLGLVNVQGEVLPVIDLRSCLRHHPLAVDPQDVLVIVTTGDRRVALAADAVGGVLAYSELELVREERMLRQSPFLEGVVKLPDGMLLVCDLQKILSTCSVVTPGAAVPGLELGEPDRGEALTGTDIILRKRAEQLAREPEVEDESARLEIVEFTLSDQHYGIEYGFIREVYPLRELTVLPCTPPFVRGIVNLRGKILSVLDIRKFFEMPERGMTDLNKVIVLCNAAMEFGILAEAIIGVRSIRSTELQPSLPTLTGVRGDYLKGVARDLVVLDAGKMLSDRRMVVHEEV